MAVPVTKSRTRSPRYPNHSLEDAITYAAKIYAGVHRSSIDGDSAFRLMGFSGKSGASATALGSVRQYGLVEGIGDKTRISNLALKILEPASSAEFGEGVYEASMHPTVFLAVFERFDGKIPPADEPIRAFLIRELGFSKIGADECIAALRKTLAYAQIHMPVARHSSEIPVDSESNLPSLIVENETPSGGSITIQEKSPSEIVRIRLTRGCLVEMKFEGLLDSKALNNLIRHIELMKEVWLED